MINSRQLSPPGGGGIPLYKPYRYRPLQRVWFLRRFGLESGMVLKGTTGVSERIDRFNSKWVKEAWSENACGKRHFI